MSADGLTWKHQAAQRREMARRHAVHGRGREVLAGPDQQSRIPRPQPRRPQPGQGHHGRRARRDPPGGWKLPYSPYMSILSLTFIVPKHILEKRVRSEHLAVPQRAGRHRAVPLGRARARRPHQLNANPAITARDLTSNAWSSNTFPISPCSTPSSAPAQVDYTGLQGITAELRAGGEDAEGPQDLRLRDAVGREHRAQSRQVGPFADRAVREALYLAINKQAIIDALNYGLPTPTESFVPQQAWSFQPDLPQHKYDPAKANALLDAAGWTPRRRRRAREGRRASSNSPTRPRRAITCASRPSSSCIRTGARSARR